MSHLGSFADACLRPSLDQTSLSFPFLQHSYSINSRRASNHRAKYLHSWPSILPRSVLSTLVCFRNISPPHSTCITSIYSCHPSLADWSHAIPPPPSIFDYSSCSNIASPRCCTCTISRCERLRLTAARLSLLSLALFSNPHPALYAYTKYHIVASHHCLRTLHYIFRDSTCICMTVQHTSV
jgi:hypothetical protein